MGADRFSIPVEFLFACVRASARDHSVALGSHGAERLGRRTVAGLDGNRVRPARLPESGRDGGMHTRPCRWSAVGYRLSTSVAVFDRIQSCVDRQRRYGALEYYGVAEEQR
jgi:hypothetical protein